MIETAGSVAGILELLAASLYLQDVCWMIMTISSVDMYDFTSQQSCPWTLLYDQEQGPALQESWQHELLNVYL